MSVELSQPAALLAMFLLLPAAWLGLASNRLPGRRRRLATALRLLVLTLVILSLARPRLLRPAGQRVTVFLMDASGSLPPDERARAEAFLGAAAELSRDERQLAVVVFGAEARVDRSARTGPLDPLRTTVDAGATDIAAALRLGAGLLPTGSSGRLVLVSDGRANRGQLEREATLMAARGIPVDVLPLAAGVSGAEAWLARLDAPASVRPGQSIDLGIEIRATAAGPARLQVLRDGLPIEDRRLDLSPGSQRIQLSDRSSQAGPLRYLALLDAEEDGRTENNTAAALTLVAGEPKVAILAGEPSTARALGAALRTRGREIEILPPDALPSSALALAAWDAFVLVDLPARAMPPASQAALATAVRDLGRGLIMVGGPESFGAGGWRGTPVEAALPVEMLVEADERRPDIGLVFLVDRSSSMGEPASAASPAPVSKLDLAKEAVLQAGALLRPDDQLGVFAFDIAAYPAWPLQPATDPLGFEEGVLGIQAQGGTNLAGGLSPARRALADLDATRKHVILLSDGWTDLGGQEAARREAQRLASEGVSLSVVAIGEASAPELAELARLGGGRYLPARDAAEVPRIFVEETQLALGSFVVEARFGPLPGDDSAILRGLDARRLPPLDGYNATTARPSARVALVSPLEDPLLAHWPHGLGRSVAWTSDLSGQWAADWLDWPDFARFVTQLVDWTLPAGESQGLEVDVALDGHRAEIEVRLTDPVDQTGAGATVASLETRLVGSDGETLDLVLEQVGAGRFEAFIELPSDGAWLLRATGRDASGKAVAARTAGFVLPVAPEYAELAETPTDPRLGALAQSTGGRVLDPSRPEDSFDPVPGAYGSSEIWPWLCLLAILLFPLDVAARRVGLGAALSELRGRGHPHAAGGPPSDDRAGPPPPPGAPAAEQTGSDAETHAPFKAGLDGDTPPPAGDLLDRLREARRRANDEA